MAPEFCSGLPNSEEVNGAYRELEEFVLKLAEMFIVIDQALGLKSFFNHFRSDKYHFRLAIGADGAPFGKDDEATAWFISCLNVASHIASPNQNFLIAGANCSETHVCMQRYARKLVNDMNSITSKSYKLMDFDIMVSFELLPSDMKWLAFMGEELSNAAFYFSPFGNVNDDTKSTVNGTLGAGDQNTWQPWPYDKRLETAAKVSNLKQQLQAKNYAESTKRKKVLDFIRDQKSRQEFEPVIGPMVNVGYAEPLHNGNNGWQFLHSWVLDLALMKSHLPGGCSELEKLSADSPFLGYLNCLRNTLGLTRLVKKVKKWFTEGRKKSWKINSKY